MKSHDGYIAPILNKQTVALLVKLDELHYYVPAIIHLF